jgi:hypothetical protein
MNPDVTQEIDDAIVSIDRSSLPKELRVRIDNHRDNLCNLAASLLEGGHDIDEVRPIISTVMDSFKEELARVMVAFSEKKIVN